MSSTRCKPLFLLIDCNNFYVSCERLFRPDLEGRPVVVLSNNDGCIVSRSAEAKALGIGMGEPEFKARPLLEKHGVEVFSSNYELYGDISRRVMEAVASVVPDVEQYSIDECFVRLAPALVPNALEAAREIRARVLRWTGITVSVGIASTRTLAKLAGSIAKKGTSGVFWLNGTEARQDELFRRIPASEVWGIGRRRLPLLERFAIRSVYDLKKADDLWVKERLTVAGWRTVLELRGIPCIDEGRAPAPRRTLVCSRSFGSKTDDLAQLEQAVSSFAANAGRRLRAEGLTAAGISVHIRTSRERVPFVSETAQRTFRIPTADSQAFISAALAVLRSIYRPGVPYAKAGIMLFDLAPKSGRQGSLLALGTEESDKKREALMASLDRICARHGRRSVRWASEGPEGAAWHMNQAHLSPQRTTDWTQLAPAVCGKGNVNFP